LILAAACFDFVFTCELTPKFQGGIGPSMEHKGIEYSVVQTTGPFGWRWTVYPPGHPPKTGTGRNRDIALRFARMAIDQAIKVKPTKPEPEK
jgi:hypothetical protein